MTRLRHTGRLIAELFRYAAASGNWWIFAVVLGLVCLTALAGAVEAIAPYAIYPIF